MYVIYCISIYCGCDGMKLPQNKHESHLLALNESFLAFICIIHDTR